MQRTEKGLHSMDACKCSAASYLSETTTPCHQIMILSVLSSSVNAHA